jgi:hypothetical protein
MELMQSIIHRLLFVKLLLHVAEKRLLLEREFAGVSALNLTVLIEQSCFVIPLDRAAMRLDLSFVTFSEPVQCLDEVDEVAFYQSLGAKIRHGTLR